MEEEKRWTGKILIAFLSRGIRCKRWLQGGGGDGERERDGEKEREREVRQ